MYTLSAIYRLASNWAAGNQCGTMASSPITHRQRTIQDRREMVRDPEEGDLEFITVLFAFSP